MTFVFVARTDEAAVSRRAAGLLVGACRWPPTRHLHHYYNTARPHRGIGRRTPTAAWTARPKAIPVRQGIQISQHFRVRTDRVDNDGKLTLRHNSRLHHIGIGHRWTGTRVLMLIRDLNIRIIAEDTGQLQRELQLDPSRDYQPQARKV